MPSEALTFISPRLVIKLAHRSTCAAIFAVKTCKLVDCCVCNVSIVLEFNVSMMLTLKQDAHNRHSYMNKKPVSLNSSVMDDNHDRYQTANIQTNQLF
jgi:hypothetical protein